MSGALTLINVPLSTHRICLCADKVLVLDLKTGMCLMSILASRP